MRTYSLCSRKARNLIKIIRLSNWCIAHSHNSHIFSVIIWLCDRIDSYSLEQHQKGNRFSVPKKNDRIDVFTVHDELQPIHACDFQTMNSNVIIKFLLVLPFCRVTAGSKNNLYLRDSFKILRHIYLPSASASRRSVSDGDDW